MIVPSPSRAAPLAFEGRDRANIGQSVLELTNLRPFLRHTDEPHPPPPPLRPPLLAPLASRPGPAYRGGGHGSGHPPPGRADHRPGHHPTRPGRRPPHFSDPARHLRPEHGLRRRQQSA